MADPADGNLVAEIVDVESEDRKPAVSRRILRAKSPKLQLPTIARDTSTLITFTIPLCDLQKLDTKYKFEAVEFVGALWKLSAVQAQYNGTNCLCLKLSVSNADGRDIGDANFKIEFFLRESPPFSVKEDESCIRIPWLGQKVEWDKEFSREGGKNLLYSAYTPFWLHGLHNANGPYEHNGNIIIGIRVAVNEYGNLDAPARLTLNHRRNAVSDLVLVFLGDDRDDRLGVPKQLLMLHSQFFRSMLLGQFTESGQNEVQMGVVSKAEMVEFIRYLQIPEWRGVTWAEQMLNTARYLQADGVMTSIEDKLYDIFKNEGGLFFSTHLHLAVLFNLHRLKRLLTSKYKLNQKAYVDNMTEAPWFDGLEDSEKQFILGHYARAV